MKISTNNSPGDRQKTQINSGILETHFEISRAMSGGIPIFATPNCCKIFVKPATAEKNMVLQFSSFYSLM